MSATQAAEPERPRLSKAAVIERALALGDAEGLDAVTIRRLATELGVTPMALYWHFRSKDELLTGLAESVWGDIDTDTDTAADWLDQLRHLLESLVRVLRRHPVAAQLMLSSNKRNTEAALVASEAALAVLHRGGFDPATAAGIVRNAMFTGLMLTMSEPGREPGITKADTAEHLRRYRLRLSLLPPDQFPRLIEAAEPMTSCNDPDAHYRLGMDLFIAGVRELARRQDRT